MARFKKLYLVRTLVLFAVVYLFLRVSAPHLSPSGILLVGPRKDVLQHVNVFIGTTNGGHAFPGASLPYGMAKASPDCLGEAHGGFATDGSDIVGFSHMHDSGTGGTLSLGNFPLFPQYCVNNTWSRCKLTKRDRRIPRLHYAASPGYFDITLADGIRGESTVTTHTALHRFTFPHNTSYYGGGSLLPVISIDLANLANARGGNASVSVDLQSGRISGNGTFKPSFGQGAYVLHFCVDFKGASLRTASVWISNQGRSEGTINRTEMYFEPNQQGGGIATFGKSMGETSILARVGLSFMSASQACHNAESEIPEFDFERVKLAAEAQWRKKLDVVEVIPGDVPDDLQAVFWSGIYRTMISPQDYTGENPLWNSSEPYFDSFYCIWDSFRSQHPFLTLVDPVEQTRMVRALIDIYKHEGKLPDCRMSFCKGFTQGGSNADVVLADAYIKNLTDGIDWNLGYEAVMSDAEDEPKNWDFSGRGGLESWKDLNYIPYQNIDNLGSGLRTRSVSRTVEYAYDDFCIAQMAAKMGKVDDQKKYEQRAGNWQKLFKANETSSIDGIDTGFIGFLQPRKMDGTWIYQNPIRCSPLFQFHSCYLDGGGGETYEGSLWMYTFFVPQDMATLVTLLGGPSRFNERLAFLHESGLLYMGDEQAFLTVFLYHYAGRPALSAQQAHAYIPNQFNNSNNGIPGNDDSGAMGSFASFVMMGIFPNPGQDVYLITPPFFQTISITNPVTGKTATIQNINFDAEYKNIYIQQATRDGKPWTRNWIDHSFFTEGGLLELTLGPEESAWGTKDEDLPPSLSTRGKI